MINVPKYRAKKIGSDEYVVGILIPENPDQQHGIMTYEQTPMCHETGHIDCYMQTNAIDWETLAINFPDMKDSNNKPIFASLSESGKGGDRLTWHNQTDEPDVNDSVVTYKNMTFEAFGYNLYDLDLDSMFVVGIQC